MSNAVRKEEVDNLDFVTKVKDSHDMSYRELARLPDRAVKIIKLKLKSEGPLI